MSRASRRRAAAGFTLLELVFAVVLSGILTRYAMMKMLTPGTMTLPAQAQTVAASIRRAQGLAIERGQRMSVSVAASGANGTLAIACASSAPCSTNQTLTLAQGVAIDATSPVYFNSLGQPVTSAAVAASAATANSTFRLSYVSGAASSAQTVTVAPLTGRVTVGP